MLRAFFDESGTDPRGRAFIVAGWVGSVEEWEVFSYRWQQALDKSPSIEYFKHDEASSRDDQFLKLSVSQRDTKLMELAQVICDSDIYGMIASVRHRIFDTKPKETRKIVGTRQYDWGFFTALSSVLQHEEQIGNTSNSVDFVFDQRSELRSCIAFYEDHLKDLPTGYQAISGTVIPGDDKLLAPLQAADLLASQFSHLAERGAVLPAYRKLAETNRVMHSPFEPTRELFEVFDLSRVIIEQKRVHTELMMLKKKITVAKKLEG